MFPLTWVPRVVKFVETESRMVVVGGEGGGEMNWEIGIDMYTLMCIKWMINKNLLYKKVNKIKFKKKKLLGMQIQKM